MHRAAKGEGVGSKVRDGGDEERSDLCVTRK